MIEDNKKTGSPIFFQLLNLIPKHIIKESVAEHKSDHYYKTMTTEKQLYLLLYAVISKSLSISSLLKSFCLFGRKIICLGFNKNPAKSTFSDANRNRDSKVFASIYFALVKHYQKRLSHSYLRLMLNGEIAVDKVKIFDATIITLFTDVFKACGRIPHEGKRKGGEKQQTLIDLASKVPEVVVLGDASKNDKDFIGQLTVTKGNFYVFDKGYVNYNVWLLWTKKEAWFVTRLNENANYKTIEIKYADSYENLGVNIVSESTIVLKTAKERDLKLRKIVYKDPIKGRLLTFISNNFEVKPSTICSLYKSRWEIEVFFKQLKQNFNLSSFLSDSRFGIESQTWSVLIANLLFTVLHKRIEEAVDFIVMVSVARLNLVSYVSIESYLKKKMPVGEERNLENVQLSLFNQKVGTG